MESQLTVRVDKGLDREIRGIARKLRLKRSDVVRMALERLVEDFQGSVQKAPYEKVKSLLGSVSSGIPDLGEAHREHLVRRMRKGA